MARHNLTEDEIHTLLYATGKRQPADAPVMQQTTSNHGLHSANAKSVTPNSDAMLNTIQGELRQIRSLISSRINSVSAISGHASPLKLRIHQRLANLGFQPEVAERRFMGLSLAADETTAWQQIVLSLETQLPVARENLLEYQGIVAFVGPTGSGKTTGIAKLATQFIQQHNKQDIGLITSDFYSVYGRDQLSIYGRILDIPVHRVNTSADLTEALEDLSDKQLILIDTPGLSQRDPSFADKMSLLLHQPKPIKSILTLAATTHEHLLEEIIHTFNYTRISGVSISKIDEAPYIGHIISACLASQLPIVSLSNGQQVSNNFSIATLANVLHYSLLEYNFSSQLFSAESTTAKHSTTEEIA
jgi:flagellar biosynthesis protein FlhF